MRNGVGGVESAAFALHCIGDVRLYRGGDDCTPKSKKARALLAVLAAEQRALTRVRIIDLLWSDRQEEQARASLRTLLADLREQLGGDFERLLRVDRERVALADGVRSDLTDVSLIHPGDELFEGLDHLDPELDDWLRIEREKWRELPRSMFAQTPRNVSARRAGRTSSAGIVRFIAIGVLVAGALAVLLFLSSAGERANTDEKISEARHLLLKSDPAKAEAARQILIGYVQAHPGDAKTLAMLAEATIAASDHPGIGGTLPFEAAKREARAYSMRAIRLNPSEASGWAALGFSHFASAAGVRPLEKAVELDPDNAGYRWRLARGLEYENRYDEAYLHSQRAIALDPLGAEPMIGFIRAASQLDRIEEMKAEVLAYARRKPASADLAHVKGYFAYASNDDPTCVKFLEPLIKKGNYRPLSTLVSCLTALGERRRAIALSSRRPSFVSDILRDDAGAVVRRARMMGRDFWLRNFESLAAADLLVRAGKSRDLIQLFDASYESVADFEREGGRVALEPTSVLLAMQKVGRTEDARRLREVLFKQVKGQRDGMGLDTWSLFAKAALALADGDRDRSVAILEQCFPDCFYGYLTMDISETAFFGQLVGHPGFDRLVWGYRELINSRRKRAGWPPLRFRDEDSQRS